MITPIPVALTARTAVFRLAIPGARYHLPAPREWALTGGSRLSGRTDRAVLALHDLAPDRSCRLTVEGMAPLDFRTLPCAGAVELEDGGSAQAAVDRVPPGGTLLVPEGRWEIGPVFLKPDMTLHLSAGAKLVAKADRAGWPILSTGEGASWEGLPEPCFAAPLTGIGAHGLKITGAGRIDGGGGRGDWWTWPKETREGARRPRLLHLIRADDVVLAGPTFANAASWTIHPWKCRRLTATALEITAPVDSPNTDGLDPESCEDVLIEGVRFSTGDDCIAIKAGKRGPEGETAHLAPCARITIRHCLMQDGHGGVVLGSEMSGGISDVTVAQCDMAGTDRGIRIKTRRGRGGAIERLTVRDVGMRGVGTAIAVNAHYYCDPDGHDAWVQSRAAAPVTETTPRIAGIEIDDVQADGVTTAFAALLGLPEAPIEDVRLGRVSVAYAPAPPAVPLMADHVRPVAGGGILAEHCHIQGAPDLPRGTLSHLPTSPEDLMLTDYFDGFAASYRLYKDGAWCYEDGCVYRGLDLLHRATGEDRWLAHLLRLVDPQVAPDGTLKGYRIDEYNIDNILAGRVLFRLADLTGEPRWMKAADLLARQLETHPRTASGNYFHKNIYPDQVWLDGLYMGLPFQIEYGQRTGRPDLVRDALRQLQSALEMTANGRGLYVHGVDESRAQDWADPATGRSPACWARALGWLAMALVDAIDLAGTEAQSLTAPTRALLQKIAGLRTPGGLWLQVIDRPDLPGNYEESSASAMFAYAFAAADRLGLMPGAAPLAAQALDLLEGRIENGRFGGICHVAGLGGFGGVYRSGTPEYYLTEAVVADDAKGSGPLMMAAAECRRAIAAEGLRSVS
jgi:polygalacturonase/rhamnogalacturonyl hydrolase YesR